MSTGAGLCEPDLTMADLLPEAFFLPARGGSLFCLYHAPQGPVLRGRVLHLHPFAEELNTCRRVSAQFARALSADGYAVLQFDMHGCGDSEGEFADATWPIWLNNAHDALVELNRRAAEHDTSQAAAPLWLWGVRSGALLASDMLKDMRAPCHMLWWQPVVSGQQVLQQWLRLDAAKAWLGQGQSGKAAPPNEQLKQGQTVHVAGYPITPALSQSLSNTTLQAGIQGAGKESRLRWMELTTTASDELPPAATRHAQQWQDAGWDVSAHVVSSPPFWQQFGDISSPQLMLSSLRSMT